MRGHELGGNDTLAMSLRKAFATCKNGTLPKPLGRMEDFCISGPWALLCRSRVEPPPEVRAHKGQAPEPGWGLRFLQTDFDLKYLRFRFRISDLLSDTPTHLQIIFWRRRLHPQHERL